MKKLFGSTVLLSVFAIAIVFISTPIQAQAPGTFDLTVKHNINGVSLGLEKELTVDVYANGGYAFTFSFGETVDIKDVLTAGDYTIEVRLNPSTDADDVIMGLGPVTINEGDDVMIKAQLSGGKTPVLKAKIK